MSAITIQHTLDVLNPYTIKLISIFSPPAVDLGEVVQHRIWSEKGTLFNIRNIINRRNISRRCKEDLNAHEDCFELVVTCHVLASVMCHCGMSSIAELPSSTVTSHDIWMESDTDRKAAVMDLASAVVEKYVDVSPHFSTELDDASSESSDRVHSYACETLILGLIYIEFHDAIRG